ncbi:HAD-IA family hydrolase, partial [Leptospira borgpetersenii serovar Ballum]|nr:HAD-IA family hydrolase [Leptospira borgpetersenii serovar Ballum]
MRQWNAAATVGELLALLTADGRHQRVLDEGLQRLGRWLEQPEVKERASQLIVRYIQREWPTLSSTVNWVKPIDEIGDSLAERKPHPLPLLHAAQAIGIAAEDCVYVGDDERDIIAARAAAM